MLPSPNWKMASPPRPAGIQVVLIRRFAQSDWWPEAKPLPQGILGLQAWLLAMPIRTGKAQLTATKINLSPDGSAPAPEPGIGVKDNKENSCCAFWKKAYIRQPFIT